MVKDMMHESGRKYEQEDITNKIVEHQNRKISDVVHFSLNSGRELRPSTLCIDRINSMQ